jgi:muramoyltetrapeptide carboxypeptidase
MIVPPALKQGSKIGIVSTASAIDETIVNAAKELLLGFGYQVVLGKHVAEKFHQFAGTDAQRAEDMQLMIDDPSVCAIICSRGGYGTLRTLQNINWESFLTNPKWIVGFSDVTVLHAKLNQLQVASIHGVMPRYFTENGFPTESFNFMKMALEHQPLSFPIPPCSFNREGTAQGELTGGNLSILYSLRGTPIDIDTKGKILFIEDLSEYYYHLDRMMQNLKFGGKLAELAGLVVGSFTGMKDNDAPFGKITEEIILDAVSEYQYPVLFNFPAGHQSKNFALKMGITASLNVNNNLCTLFQP